MMRREDYTNALSEVIVWLDHGRSVPRKDRIRMRDTLSEFGKHLTEEINARASGKVQQTKENYEQHKKFDLEYLRILKESRNDS